VDKPWKPCKWEPADYVALQALERGEANEDQQKRALKWLIEVACMTYQPTHYPDQRDTDFANGRRYVGLKIVEALHINVGEILRRKNVNTG